MSARHPEIIFVVAVARNGVIGRENQLPWRLKADLAHFKATTLGHPILMGRKTWESLGRPLPGRRNLVVTRNTAYPAPGAEVFPDIDAALEAVGTGKVYVIGGAELFRQLLDRVDVLVLTEVLADVSGDVYFPTFDRGAFTEERRESHPADSENEYPVDFVELRRKPAR
ncbi:MAG: dihydrofolate reductase [Aromatoleum sp.]|jgi:dihydrofolate reductase|uniref:dihydrofolate reductase n=1 Tax=Aromatoleum sp. TaxID=2307007 RepID=UPI002894675E|nr:dihydrofolate reductase [Aromatoleum sp.]MDT3670757.1 dihydrofolate reductase [Aromatoleum sp.]